MKRILMSILMSILMVALPLTGTIAQQNSAAKSLASTIEVYVFPGDGQNAAAQSRDEVECYNWATSNTGSDPFSLVKQQAAQQQDTEYDKQDAAKAGEGSGARGAVRGAAMGALIGEIADDDAGKGAAYGAAAGLIRGRRQGRAASQRAQAEAQERGQAKQQATGRQIENFKKAFSICLEAKEYLVKY